MICVYWLSAELQLDWTKRKVCWKIFLQFLTKKTRNVDGKKQMLGFYSPLLVSQFNFLKADLSLHYL